jgi:polyhydroxybutyrate depolymerase
MVRNYGGPQHREADHGTANFLRPHGTVRVMTLRIFAAAISLVALAGCAPGPDTIDLVSAGEPRSYKLVTPPGGANTPRPLVIALHGWLGTPAQMESMSGLSAASARFGFAVVYPAGNRRAWGIDPASPRGAADAAFLADMVADVAGKTPVDPARIYAVGFSNGGLMAQALACSGRVRLAGIAVVASGLAAPAAAACRPGSGVPFLLIQGTDDPVMPVAGTDTRAGRILPASETLAFWAAENRCRGFDQAGATSREPGFSILRDIGRQCRGGETEAWFIIGAGHGWPGGEVGYPELLVGRSTSAIDATSVIVGFLLRQALGRLGGG